MNRNRCIFHVDMDAFYASVEQRDHPEMLGLPVVVGGGERRGVVAAASYEARRFGVRSAMPMAEALRRCPKAVRVRPRMHHYKSVSQEIFDIFADFTPVVEGLSLDEAFLDLSGSIAGPAAAHDIATQLKLRIRRELALTASIGVGPNKLVAKIASDLDKPDGLRIVTAEQLHATLDPLPVQRIPGIGPRTLPRLYDAGIKTIGDLRLASEQKLRPVFGRHWYTTQQRAAGCDEREVHSHGIAKSVSAETTFDLDINDSSELMRVVSRLTDQSIGRLRRQELEAAVVTLKIRDHKFRTATRQRRCGH
ncbi:MAG: DNA polymerase IV, partial [Chromatiales bacterium]|nr:DNA polymerase IV [Chromatiales bacterium]